MISEKNQYAMTGFQNFTDIEVYTIKRAFIESSANIFLSDKSTYNKEVLEAFQDLLNRAIEEDSKRLYGNKHTTQSQFEIRGTHPYD